MNMKNGNVNLSRSDKILLTLFRLTKGSKKKIRFEDIAVSAFKSFPEDFQLKGYPEYPDTGDIIHKPLYSELKKAGFVLSGNKYFSMTSKGIERGKVISLLVSGKKRLGEDTIKFTPTQRTEIEGILSSKAYELFKQGKSKEILDIDFYSYLGVSVRTSKYDFMGRLNSIEEAIKSVVVRKPNVGTELLKLHSILMKKFSDNVRFFLKKKGGK